jgi:hypothetical protein
MTKDEVLKLDLSVFKQYKMPESRDYIFATPPKPIGYWVLYPQGTPHTQFAMYHKPTDEQIKNTGQLLGWAWEDA